MHLAPILDLFFEDSQLNVQAGELEVRPPWYDALKVQVRRRVGRGSSLQASYPWSRALLEGFNVRIYREWEQRIGQHTVRDVPGGDAGRHGAPDSMGRPIFLLKDDILSGEG